MSAAGATSGMQLYKPWGEGRGTSSITLTKYQYTGQFNDSYINLYWIGSRWYDPALGRWIQPDPIVPLESQGTQAWDRFAYVNNNAVKYTDPSGHCIFAGVDTLACVGVVAVVVVATAVTTMAVSEYYSAGGPEAVADAIENVGNQAAEKLRSLAKSTEPKPLTDDEKGHVDKLTKKIDEFIKKHPDLPSEIEKVAEGDELAYDHVKEAEDFARGLQNSIDHLELVKERRTQEAQQAIEQAVAHGQEMLNYLLKLLGGL